ncbi:MAG: HlyD family efflux transporter periplasmic adaptor subunit [Opitutus sp.]|nr:HlyD family efflux transporter periplasmic adaptor subunit [Opitutus sp.]
MDSRILTPIPTPPAQRWREIRLFYLPRTLFVLAVLLVAWLWKDAVGPGAIVAEAEVVGADLRATQAGVISSLKRELHQAVRAGEIVGTVAAPNPQILVATVAVIRAEVAMLSASMSGLTDRQRIALDFEQMQLTSMGHRVERATLQGRLQQNDADLARAEPLFRAKLITEASFADLKITHESLVTQLNELNKLIARMEPIVRNMIAADPQGAALSVDSALTAAIKVQDAKLRLAEEQLSPVPLTAPIDGVVTLVLRRAGEAVVAGEPILRITAPKATRLSAYIRQPLTFDPKPGMAAEIRTRSIPPKVASTTITLVGTALETISPTVLAAMHLPTTPTPETGLRVEFALPANFTLRPGEHVDLRMR